MKPIVLPPRHSLPFAVLLACLATFGLAACRSSEQRASAAPVPEDVVGQKAGDKAGDKEAADDKASAGSEPQAPEFVPPPPPQNAPKDWIRLKSGEWLRGEIKSLTRHTLEFESDELDELSLDWDDVREVRTNRPFSVLRGDRTTVTGAVTVFEERVIVKTETGEYHTNRSNVTRMVTGSVHERDHWSGKVTLGAVARSGNTDQVDLSTLFSAKRRTASSRLDLRMMGAYSEVNQEQTVNNERFEGTYDIFVGPRLFVTPLALDLYRDTFQNIDLQVVPYTGIGYTVADRNKLEWDVNLGFGFRYTRFESVGAGEEQDSGLGTGVVGTSLDSDLTKRLELLLSYSAQIGLTDINDTNQNASVTFSLDLLKDFDFDLAFLWTRIGAPEADENDVTPEKNDYRLTFGLGWEF